MESIVYFLDNIGYYGPIILFFIVCYFLWKRPKYLQLYIICFFLNTFINKCLKLIFREPRPDNPIEFAKFENYKNEELYGMPSGHAQSAFFSIVYLYNLQESVSVLLATLFIGCVTLYQRWKYRRHTAKQLIVGSSIGALFAWTIYSLEKYINK
jgi:membrane-associated phospholipid phosphatase